MSDRRVVSDAELNRATLARQLLLHRIELDPVTAISRLFALQAQEPPSPYLALWTRLKDFDPPALDHAFASWAVVKATLMRMTLHVVAAEDYPSFWAAHAGSLCRARTRMVRFAAQDSPPERIDELLAQAVAFAAQPRSNADMKAYLDDWAGPLGDLGWWWALRAFAPVIHAPCNET